MILCQIANKLRLKILNGWFSAVAPHGKRKKQGLPGFLLLFFRLLRIRRTPSPAVRRKLVQGGRGEVGARHKERTYSTNKKTHAKTTQQAVSRQKKNVMHITKYKKTAFLLVLSEK